MPCGKTRENTVMKQAEDCQVEVRSANIEGEQLWVKSDSCFGKNGRYISQFVACSARGNSFSLASAGME